MFGVLFGITAGIMTEVAIKSLFLEAARYDPEDRVASKVGIYPFGYIREWLVLRYPKATAIFEQSEPHLNDCRPFSTVLAILDQVLPTLTI